MMANYATGAMTAVTTMISQEGEEVKSTKSGNSSIEAYRGS
jgi:hypothetical protein